jgi:uncharacterized membrane protein YeaQ/YmgE (transglycosylase-associated protein family)
MRDLCGWIVFGFVVGLIARFIMPGRQNMGFIRTTALGVAGSFTGGLLTALIWGGNWRNPTSASWIGSVVGALLLLVIFGGGSSNRR